MSREFREATRAPVSNSPEKTTSIPVDTALSSYQRLGVALRSGLERDAACHAAARSGNVDALQWMRRWWPPSKWGDELCEAAAVGGHVAVLQWLRRETPCVWTLGSMEAVARAGRMEMFLYRVDGPRAASDDRHTRAGVDRMVLRRLLEKRLTFRGRSCSRRRPCSGAASTG